MTSLLKTLVVRDPASDAQLLGRFVRDRDDAAFTELVRRHGPLVLGVCRRVIPDRHLADDAFQAAFVVLARKAESVQPDKLASWLYGVSYKVALRARTMAGRRAKHETLTATLPETPVPPDPVDDGVLDAEIANLPALYRDAVVLCELQGVSRHDAAKTLGILEGTLSSRLAKARKLLAVALARRGVTMPATLAVTTTVTLELCTATVRAAIGTLAPPLVATLANGVLRTMLLSKLKLTAVIGVFAAMLLSLGIGSITRPEEAIAAPVPLEAKDEGLIWLHHRKSGLLTAYSPDGKKEKEFTLKDGRRFLGITPDGQKIAFQGKNGKLPAENDNVALTVHLRDVNEETVGEDTGFSLNDGDVIIWSPDRKQAVRLRSDVVDNQIVHMHVLFDLASKKETKIELPANHYMRQWSADGKTWQLHEYVRADVRDANLPRYRMMSVPVGGGKPTPLCDNASLLWLDATGDGQTSIGFGHGHTNPANENEDATYRRWFRVNAKGEATLVKTFDEFDGIELRLAPNRQRVVCLGQTSAFDKPGNSTLLLYDPDGKNERKLVTIPHEGKPTTLLGWFPAKVAAKRIAPVPKEEPDDGMIWLLDPAKGELVGYTPGGKPARTVKLADGAIEPRYFLGITRDGQNAMFVGKDGKIADPAWESLLGRLRLSVHLRPLHSEGKPFDTGILYRPYDAFTTSPDGQHLYRRRDVSKLVGEEKRPEYAVTRFEATGKNPEAIDLPDRMRLREALPSGEFLLDEWNGETRAHRCAGGGKPVCVTADLNAENASYSPDGRSLLVTKVQVITKEKEEHYTLARVDPAGGKHERIDGFEGTAFLRGYWSPDGKRVVMQWHRTEAIGTENGKTFTRAGAGTVVVRSADGTGEKQLLALEDPGLDGLNGRSVTQGRHVLGWFPKKASTKPALKRIAPVPKAEPDMGLLWLHDTKAKKLIAKSPDGRTHQEIDLPEGDRFLGFTADGTKIFFAGKNGKVADADVAEGLTLHLRSDFVKPEGTDSGLGYQPDDFFVFSPDEKQIVRQRCHRFENAKPKFSHVLFDVATKKETKIDLPSDHQLMQWSADGKTWRVVKNVNEQWLSMPAGGGKLTPINDSGSFMWLDPSHDGKTYLASGDQAMFQVDAANGKTTKIAAFKNLEYVKAMWSPDGHRIGCMKYDFDSANNRRGDSHLLLFDADGKNEKELLTIKDDGQTTRFLGWYPTAK